MLKNEDIAKYSLPGIALQVETSEVHIPDFDYDTISWMLRYMYGCLELSPQSLSHAKVNCSICDSCLHGQGKGASAASATDSSDAFVQCRVAADSQHPYSQ